MDKSSTNNDFVIILHKNKNDKGWHDYEECLVTVFTLIEVCFVVK